MSVEDSGHYRAQLLFSYSLQPHIVVQTHDIPTRDSDSNHPIPINCVAETVFATEMLPEYEWQWGEMRGYVLYSYRIIVFT